MRSRLMPAAAAALGIVLVVVLLPVPGWQVATALCGPPPEALHPLTAVGRWRPLTRLTVYYQPGAPAMLVVAELNLQRAWSDVEYRIRSSADPPGDWSGHIVRSTGGTAQVVLGTLYAPGNSTLSDARLLAGTFTVSVKANGEQYTADFRDARFLEPGWRGLVLLATHGYFCLSCSICGAAWTR